MADRVDILIVEGDKGLISKYNNTGEGTLASEFPFASLKRICSRLGRRSFENFRFDYLYKPITVLGGTYFAMHHSSEQKRGETFDLDIVQ